MEQTNSSVETTIEQSRVAEETPNQETPKKVEDKITIKPEFSKFKESDEVL